MSFSARSHFGSSVNALAARRSALEADGRSLIDLTLSLAPLRPSPLSSLPITVDYRPEPFGLPEARAAVARWYGGEVRAEQLLLAPSTSDAYGWLFKLLCDPGDEVVVPAPCYPLFDSLAQLEGVRCVRVPLHFDGQWVMPLPSHSERLRAVVVVSPNNPTGHRPELGALAEWCAAHDVALIIDEVFESPQRSALHRAWPCLTFVLAGLSKSAGLPQLKVAWAGVTGPGRAEAMERLASLADTYLPVGQPVQQALPALLDSTAAFRELVETRCARNRQTLRSLHRADSSWNVVSADAGWSAVIRIPSQPGEEATCLQLLERGVVVQPGYFYDFPLGAHLVLSLLPEPEVFEAGARIALC